MTPQTAFKLSWGVKLHFSSMGYSILKYGTNTKAAQAKYDGLTQQQRYRYEWLSSKFSETQDIMYACMGCALDGVSTQFGQKEEILESFYKFKRRRESLSHVLSSDNIMYELDGYPDIDKFILKYFVGKCSPEYIIILTDGTDLLDTLYDSPNLVWARENILKLIKYKDFVNVKKYQHLITQNETAATS